MRAPMLLDLPELQRSPMPGDVAASDDGDQHGIHEDHSAPRLALYASRHSRTGRPRFVGPAPKRTWGQRVRDRLSRLFGKDHP